MTPNRTRGTSQAFRTGDLHGAQPDRGHHGPLVGTTFMAPSRTGAHHRPSVRATFMTPSRTGAHHRPSVRATFMTPSRTRGTPQAFRRGDIHDAQPDPGHITDLP